MLCRKRTAHAMELYFLPPPPGVPRLPGLEADETPRTRTCRATGKLSELAPTLVRTEMHFPIVTKGFVPIHTIVFIKDLNNRVLQNVSH